MHSAVVDEVAAPDTRRGVGAVELYWIPLGAGQRVVRISGRCFEALSARAHRRQPCDLYHSALAVTTAAGRHVIEMAPIVDAFGRRRGVVAEGPVGTKWAGRLRLFRYEIRCWRNGVIPDQSLATGSVSLDADEAVAKRLIDLLPSVPTPVWGRDELGAGDMWNSNSVISWLLTRGRIDISTLSPPDGGRAPGWDAGLVVASRGVRVRRRPAG